MSLYFETSWGSLFKQGEELCGDKVEITKSGKDTIFVLADGLGSGVKANILASLTSKIVATMLAAGAEISDVIETMASTLPVCSERQVAYSTFTVLRLSPDGQAHIVEFDNPDLILLRNGKSYPLDREYREIDGKTIRETHVELQEGDLCVFFSDGVIHAGIGKLLNFGWQHENVVQHLEKNAERYRTAHMAKEHLLSACNDLYMEEPGDDTTVCVCRARKPDIAYVMVGPPVDPEEDHRIVDELISFDGTRIICGGTTSQIVSKVTGKPLTTCLEYISPDVPPIGKMPGIDLVTEGVITLRKTLELMMRYEKGNIGRENALTSKKDGAHLLASTLILKCTGAKFVVGRALNPAHQNPDLPLNLSIKLTLVEEIAACLRRLGKEAVVEYH